MNHARGIDPARIVPIVVGAGPAPELMDRPIAAALAEVLELELRTRAVDALVIVMTDLWRLNDTQLAQQPCICIGHPEVNALSAFLADRVPPAFVIDGQLAVQFDAQAQDALALCWGTTHDATERAVGIFRERFLSAFADAAAAELG